MDNIKIADVLEMIEDFKQGTYDFTKDGECSCCGSCCSNVLPMTPKEVNKIHRYIRNHNIKPVSHIPAYMAKGMIDMLCPFVDMSREKKCLIYDVRPRICREFVCNKWTDKESCPSFEYDTSVVNMKEEFCNEKGKS